MSAVSIESIADSPVHASLLHVVVLLALENRGDLSIREVAEGSGVSRKTIEKIMSGRIADPGVSHIEKLARYFLARRKSFSFAGNAKSLA